MTTNARASQSGNLDCCLLVLPMTGGIGGGVMPSNSYFSASKTMGYWEPWREPIFALPFVKHGFEAVSQMHGQDIETANHVEYAHPQYSVVFDGILERRKMGFPFCPELVRNKITGNMRKASREKRVMLLPNPKGKLFDQIREVLRFHHYSIRTEKTYCQWIRRYLVFHRASDRSGPTKGWRHPAEMGAAQSRLALRAVIQPPFSSIHGSICLSLPVRHERGESRREGRLIQYPSNEPSLSFCRPIPGIVKLRESSGRAGGLPTEFRESVRQ